jgi:hypothetical protein
MKKGLSRVLDIRRLLEDLASLDLQTKIAALRRLENAAEEHRRLAVEGRSEAIGKMLDEAAADFWLDMADAEIFSLKRERIVVAAHKTSDEVEALRERRLMRRIERKQAELLISEAEWVEEQKRRRREQQLLDDWSLLSSESRRPE